MIPKTANATSYGFVQLSTCSEAQRAISELSGKTMHDHEILVQLARKPELASKPGETVVKSAPPLTRESSQDTLATHNATIEAKRKAQTDLARQKIEALKSRTISQRQTSVSNSNAPLTNQPQQLPNRPPPTALHECLTSGAQATTSSQITPHGSYFSPSNERQPISIPGLFMAPTRPSSICNNEHPVIHLSAADRESPQAITSVPSHDTVVHNQAQSIQSAGNDFSSGKPSYVIISEALNEPASSASKVHEPRKRQKASDFIDSPPLKIRRTLGQKEDDSVIIDISEDEANGNSEDEVDAMDIEQDDHLRSDSRQIQDGHEGIETVKQRAIRDLPPLTDFPARNKISEKLASNTPPAAQSPGKPKEQEGLKTKEKEIEFMKRRIAELEQRNKAKQTSSRAQTPGTPGQLRSPPRPVEVTVEKSEQSRPGVGMKPLEEMVQEHAQAQAATLPAPNTISRITGQAESIDQVEQENDSAPTASKVLQAAKQVVSEIEREPTPDKHLEKLELAQMDIDRSLAPQLTILEENQQPPLVGQQARENAGADAATNQVQNAEVTLREEGQQPLNTEHHAKVTALTYVEMERSRSVDETSEEEQRRRRRAELESGLPILDAEVERTKLRLQLLRKQMEDLESEVQKGIEGRRSLMNELVSLSPVPSPAHTASSHNKQDSADKPVTKPLEGNIQGE